MTAPQYLEPPQPRSGRRMQRLVRARGVGFEPTILTLPGLWRRLGLEFAEGPELLHDLGEDAAG